MVRTDARVGVVGSRGFKTPSLVLDYLRTLKPGTTIFTGDDRAVDLYAAEGALELGFELVVLRADRTLHGRSAGSIRNQELIKRVDRLVAFWDKRSRDTSNTIKMAFQAGKHTTVIFEDGRRSIRVGRPKQMEAF